MEHEGTNTLTARTRALVAADLTALHTGVCCSNFFNCGKRY